MDTHFWRAAFEVVAGGLVVFARHQDRQRLIVCGLEFGGSVLNLPQVSA
jgi:hypothetical protein